MADLDYFGVDPRCGCVTAWLSGDATQAEAHDFTRRMGGSGRAVAVGPPTDAMRAKLAPCPHSDAEKAGQLALTSTPAPESAHCSRCDDGQLADADADGMGYGRCKACGRTGPAPTSTPSQHSGEDA